MAACGGICTMSTPNHLSRGRATRALPALTIGSFIIFGCIGLTDSSGASGDEIEMQSSGFRGASANAGGMAAPDGMPDPGDGIALAMLWSPAEDRPPREPAATAVDARPAALINGKSLTWGDLRPILTEIAGAQALQEALLDQRLNAAARERELVITKDHEKAEQRRLLSTLSDDPGTAVRLLDTLRNREGLGPVRYPALLRRNATLRLLVQDEVRITGDAIEQTVDVLFGAKRQVRLITVNDLDEAQSMLQQARDGAFFGDLAVRSSTDMSAARGGLLQPVSQLDPSYPRALRDAIWSLPEPGARSEPILLDSGYAIVQLVEGPDAFSTMRQ